MTVSLDAPPTPTWKVTCDGEKCRTWLYLQTPTETDAVALAVQLYRWRVEDGKHLCKSHR